MSTTAFYDHILATMDEGLPKQVLKILQRGHVGAANRIPFRVLVIRAAGTYTATTERQVREAIEILVQEHRVPVLAESGKDGRWLAGDPAEIEPVAAELESRARKLEQRAWILRQAEATVKRSEIAIAIQGKLFG